ncbi:hypothetical protein [Streptomyces sp. TLI_185]|uniref:hypothetical protein n=1 Tax=Streptomyces sp. TLI_185 TaxID=2485151 RepID=UPI0021A31907|nr:hypothetical protein [Streptomyces sp. TLI_185]
MGHRQRQPEDRVLEAAHEGDRSLLVAQRESGDERGVVDPVGTREQLHVHMYAREHRKD